MLNEFIGNLQVVQMKAWEFPQQNLVVAISDNIDYIIYVQIVYYFYNFGYHPIEGSRLAKMKTKNIGLIIFLMTALLSSGCGSTTTATPEPGVTPTTIPATITTEPSASPSATITPTETPTPAPTPTDQGDCINRAEFVSDVTVPDNTNFNPGEKFVKTWRISNTGSCTWNMRYVLVFLKGAQMSAPYSIPLTETPPGSTLDVSLDMVAPAQDGAFTGTYQFQSPSGGHFGVKDGNLWVKIVVGSGTSAPTTPTYTPQVPATAMHIGTPATNPPTITPTAGTPIPGGTPSDTPTISPTKAGQSGSCTYLENPNFVAQVFTLVNQARATNGLPAFTLNSKLSASAIKHSIDMACNNLMQHTGSDGSSAKDRVAAEGYSAKSVQEAIYAQPPQYGGTPQSAVDWWLNDAQHRPILLSSTLTEIGIGYVSVSTSALGGYFTIDFATP